MIKVSRYFFPYVIICIIAGFRGEILISVVSVLFHEVMHYLAARALGFSGFDAEITITGAKLKLESIEDADPAQDILISLSGPLSNIIAAVIFYGLYFELHSSILYIAAATNLCLGVFNLIPAFPLDGSRVLRAALLFKAIYKRANIIMLGISMFIGILMIFLYLCLELHGKNNFSLGVAGIFIIISCIKERERISYIIMGDIIKKRVNFIQRGFIQNHSTSVYFKLDLVSTLALVEKNRYNIFMILDEEMKVMDIIYEDEIIDALKKFGNMTLEEYMDNRFL